MSSYRDKFPDFSRLDAEAQAYISTRAIQYSEWYDSKAVAAKRNFLRSKVFVAIGAVASPFLSTHSIEIRIWGSQFNLPVVLAGVLGLCIAALVSLEGIYKFHEQWKNYRSTEQYIVTQIFMFGYGVDDYEQLTVADGFRKFVHNVEYAIKNENDVTLNVLARSADFSSSKLQKDGSE